MTDPVQVVAEARLAHKWIDEAGKCACGPLAPGELWWDHQNGAIVAALKAAGALMPVEAEQERQAVARYAYERTHTDALLREVREVLETLPLATVAPLLHKIAGVLP